VADDGLPTETYELIAIGLGRQEKAPTELAAFFGPPRCGDRESPPGNRHDDGRSANEDASEAALYFSGLREGDVYG